MKKIFYLFALLCFGAFNMLQAQSHLGDSSYHANLISFSFAVHLPEGDLKDRFGVNQTAGFSYLYKTKSNWFFGADFNYIFGGDVKNKEEVLEPIITADGNIIDGDGRYAELNLHERGYFTSLKLGKLFPIRSINPNSGILFLGSLGLLEHKIRFHILDNTAPQLDKDYKKGYDRLSNGLAISEFIGYLNLSENKMMNFYAGFEFIQAWTASRRNYNFSLMGQDETERFDVMVGFKVGWIFPIYGRTKDEFYYY